jgi:AraC-like DNA-binding protein
LNIRASSPAPVGRDSRGILHPWLLRRRVRLNRYSPPAELAGVIDRFWAVAWDLPEGEVHRQPVLTHPGANLSVGPADGADETGRIEAGLYGPARRLAVRSLVGRGWTVAAMTTPGGLGALVDGSVARFTDRAAPLGTALGVDAAELAARVRAAADEPARVRLLADALVAALRPDRIATAREVGAVARLAETDRSLRRLDELAERAGTAPRTLQRRFQQYAGVSPTWVLRRYRLLEAAEAVRDGAEVDWADLAAALGYADQAHLIRDFRAAVGQTPAAYARLQRPADRSDTAG